MEKTKPKEVKGEVGKSYNLKCETSHNAKWYYSTTEQLPRNKNPISYSKNLFLESVVFKNSGYYFCYGSTGVFNRKHFWSTTVIKVYG